MTCLEGCFAWHENRKDQTNFTKGSGGVKIDRPSERESFFLPIWEPQNKSDIMA